MKQKLEQRLLDRMDYSRELADDEVKEQIDNLLLQEEGLRLWTVQQRLPRRLEIFCYLRGMEILRAV
ncbi:MAG: hypothetical protein K2I01_08890, partial [Lachnospiraceae bacterium]|nr:hypothetical protein [Lachnospiraceae bacterium]